MLICVNVLSLVFKNMFEILYILKYLLKWNNCLGNIWGYKF